MVVGSFIHYRKRIRPFDKIQMRSKILCADESFIYLEQSMVYDCCAGRVLYRTKITSTDGIITTNHVQKASGTILILLKFQIGWPLGSPPKISGHGLLCK